MRSVSFDIGYSGSAFTGASDSYGIVVGGSDAGSIDYDICVYHTICDAEGIGFAVGGALTGLYPKVGYPQEKVYLKDIQLVGVI